MGNNKEEQDVYKQISLILQRHEYDAYCMLGNIVASLCDISLPDLLTSTTKIYHSQARWLYWYALRHMQGDTYEQIAQKTKADGCNFTPRSVGTGIAQMSMLIEREPKWKKRWYIIKNAIADITGDEEKRDAIEGKHEITIVVPKSIKGKININIKEKE